MAVSVEYVAKETASNLWRNRFMALAAILTVAVSLSLVGSALLLRQAVNRQVDVLSGNVSLQIFMNADATTAQTDSVRSQIAQMSSQISHCTYLDHEASYKQMLKLFQGQESIVNALTAATTPPVFNCQLVNPNDAQSVASTFHPTKVGNGVVPVPGVLQATYPEQSIKAMERVTNVVQLTLLVIAIVLLISSLVLILNAIRMAIFARREEVGVMKLVGATNWFIRVPFMLEGLFQGFAGALVAVGVVLGANIGVHALVTHYNVNAFASLALSVHELVTTEIVVVLVGVVIGALGSVFAVRRFLDV